LNLRPSGYEPDELPGCSTPHQGAGLPQVDGLMPWDGSGVKRRVEESGIAGAGRGAGRTKSA
jgi:hypothetical protein